MQRTILIVDDIETNRAVLSVMLSQEYRILEAGNGAEALELLRQEGASVSAVLLDIFMPDMNGYEVLQKIRSDSALAQLPVIMITGSDEPDTRVKSLVCGANDFILKPYHPDIIRHCLSNTIALHEIAAEVHILRHDRLTGLYNRESFLDRVGELVRAQAAGYYIMACFDIDKFKVINDQYGSAKGDEVLRNIAGVFQRGFAAQGGICCRVSADDFAVLYPTTFQDSPEIAEIRRQASHVDGLVSPIIFSIGRYVISDLTLTPSAMYDRATLAACTVKGRYDAQIAVYSEAMRGELIVQQEIVNDMVGALHTDQFEAWYQPQYNHFTGALVGAEALARWRHPTKGLISPGKFIPIFEQNGFVYELDKYIWEDACRHLRKWMDEGRTPLPVSVNISRYDIFRDDLVPVIISLIEKYSLPVELLRLEVTESAFSTSTAQIISVVRRLIDYGFTVEIDDFGSGYSSLNTLKDVPAQVLKLDMKFLESNENSQRGGNIVESIVRMAKWLGMAVIAEGVETVGQAEFLKSIGCYYIQGYLYAKPMPAEDYEAHCRGIGKEEHLLTLETVESLDNNAFWDPASMDTLIFSSYVGAACIYEYSESGRIELLRATEKYVRMISDAGMTAEEALKLNWADYLSDDGREQVKNDLEASIAAHSYVTNEYIFLDLPGCPHETHLRSSLRVIARVGTRYLIYCTNENITAQREAERREHLLAEEMQLIMDNVNSGISAAAYQPDGSLRILFANDRFYRMHGYTKAQFTEELARPLDAILPEDRAHTLAQVKRLVHDGGCAMYEYRCRKRDGSLVTICCNNTVTTFVGISDPVLLSVTTDVTADKKMEREFLDNLPYAAALYEYDGKKLTVVYINKSYWSWVNRDETTRAGDTFLEAVHPDDRDAVFTELRDAMEQGKDFRRKLRILYGKSQYRMFLVVGKIVPRTDGKYAIYVAYMPVLHQGEA